MENSMKKLVLTILFVLIGGNAFGATYYADPDGSGTTCSEGSPCTLDYAVNTKASGGDTVDLGDNTFIGELIITNSGTDTENRITITNGILYGSLTLDEAGDWTSLGSNLWATANDTFDWSCRLLFLEPMPDDYTDMSGLAIFVSPGSPDEDREYSYDDVNDRIILYCTQNPYLEYGDIIGCSKRRTIDLEDGVSNITLDGLSIYMGSISGIHGKNNSNVTVTNCTLGWFGVSDEGSGNGIQFDHRFQNISILNNNFFQAGDYAIGPHIFNPDISADAGPVLVDGNTIDRCGGGIQVAAITTADQTVTNATISNNTITRSGYGWSGYEELSSHGNGIQIGSPLDNMQCKSATVRDNIIDGYAGRGISIRGCDADSEILRNIIRNGTGLTSVGAAGIYLHGMAWDDTVADFSGIIALNLIVNNANQPGVYLRNNSSVFSFLNNTITGNGSYGVEDLTVSNNIVRNNIVYGNESTDYKESGLTDPTFEYNNYETIDGVTPGTGCLTTDPQLTATYSSPLPAIYNGGTDVGLSWTYSYLPIGAKEVDDTVTKGTGNYSMGN
jgi:hypothetical protein